MKSNRFYQLCVVVIALMPAISVAQEAPPSQYEHVKGLQPFIGFWTTEDPGNADARLTIGCRWAANKSYAQFNISTRGEERMHIGTIIVGWDGAEQNLAMWSFFPDMQTKATPSIDGGTLSWTSHGTTSDGKVATADVKFEVEGDKLNVEVRNSRRGDEKQPDMTLSLDRRRRQER